MKKDIHPDYKEITVVMSDGSEFATRSTLNSADGKFHSEVDSKNHPFFTKNQQFKKKAGQIDRFNRRYGKNK